MERRARAGFCAGSQKSIRQVLFGPGLSIPCAQELPGVVLWRFRENIFSLSLFGQMSI